MYYLTTKDQTVLPLLKKWIDWAQSTIQSTADGHLQIASELLVTGQPDASFDGLTALPAPNTGLHVQVVSYSSDLGIMACLARILLHYAAAVGETNAAKEKANAVALLADISTYRDSMGFGNFEIRKDYVRFNQPTAIPAGFVGTMASGAPINSNSTFLSLRPHIKQQPMWKQIEDALNAGEFPKLRYHRFWAEIEIAESLFTYAWLFGNIPTPTPVPPPPLPPPPTPSGNLTHQITVANSWQENSKTWGTYSVVSTNQSNQTLTPNDVSLTISADLIKTPQDIWSVSIKSFNPPTYTVGLPTWITSLAPGGKFVWGFNAAGNNVTVQ